MDIKSSVSILAFLSGIAGLLMHSNPRAGKIIGLISSGFMFVALVSFSPKWSLEIGTFMPLLIAAAAFLCILSQQPVRHAERPIFIILVLSGFSFAYVNTGLLEPLRLISLAGLLATLVLVSLSYRKENPVSIGAAVAFGGALLCLVLSCFLQGPLSVVLRLITAAVLFPLFPVQSAFVGSLTSFPGTCPAFLAMVLPCLGWYTITTRISVIPHPVAELVIGLAIIGGLVTAFRASVQIHLARAFAGIAAALLSLAWLMLGALGRTNPEITSYVMSVTVVTSGLLLCAHHLEARYGTQLRDNLRGLAQPMPKLSLLLGALIMAAAGFPPFALFSNFMAMVLSSNQLQLMLIAPAILLLCSLLLVFMMQQLLFGVRRSDLVYEDLGPSDVTALVLVAGVSVAGGLIPYVVSYQPEVAHYEQTVVSNIVINTARAEAPRLGSGSSKFSSGVLRKVTACQK